MESFTRRAYPREIGVVQVSKSGEKLAGLYAVLKKESAGLEAILKCIHDAKIIVKSLEIYGRNDTEGWVLNASLDVSESPTGMVDLEGFLKRLDCVEKTILSEHGPIMHNTSLFPIMNRSERIVLQSVKRQQGVRDQLERILTPSGLSVIFYNMGLENGRELYKMFVREFHSNMLTIRRRVEFLRDYLVACGMGILDFVDLDFEDCSGIIKLYEGYECDDMKKDRPNCHSSRGLLAGFLGSEWMTDNLKVVELKCKAMGDPHCEFAVGSVEG